MAWGLGSVILVESGFYEMNNLMDGRRAIHIAFLGFSKTLGVFSNLGGSAMLY